VESSDAGCLATAQDTCDGELSWLSPTSLRRSGFRVCKRRTEDKDIDAGSTRHCIFRALRRDQVCNGRESLLANQPVRSP